MERRRRRERLYTARREQISRVYTPRWPGRLAVLMKMGESKRSRPFLVGNRTPGLSVQDGKRFAVKRTQGQTISVRLGSLVETLESVPVDFATADECGAFVPRSAVAPPPWSPLTRLGFRIAFIYFCCFMYLYGNDGIDFYAIVFWHGFSSALNWPMNHLAAWAGSHIFRLTGSNANWHVTHRGDTLINWVLDRIFMLGALLGGLAWTVIAHLRGSRRTEYKTLLTWLRFLLRLSVGFFMVGYGMIKVFPLQMGPIPLATLNQPVGQISPHTLLWSLIGLYPVYESICGMLEVLAGTLILFRRTALVGSLFTIFVMSNVVLYNFFFGVSVKLFALNLLLAAIFITLPDAKPLFDFFWRHQPAAQTGIWVPPTSRRGVRIYVRALEIIFIIVSFTINPLFDGIVWHHERVVARIQSPLRGAWRFDSVPPAAGAFNTPNGPVAELYVDTVEYALARSADGALWRTFMRVNAPAHTVWINPYVGNQVTYTWQMTDSNHLILSVMPGKSTQEPKAVHGLKVSPASAPAVLALTRIRLPAHYRLLETKFQFVSFN